MISLQRFLISTFLLGFFISSVHQCEAQNLLWVDTINSILEPTSIQTDENNNVIHIGKYYPGKDLDPGPAVFTLPYRRIYIAKYSANGNFIWAKNFEPNYYPGDVRMSVDQSNNIILVGTFTDSAELGLNSTSHKLYTPVGQRLGQYIVKYDSNGTFVWAKQIDTGGPNYSNSFGCLEVLTDYNNDIIIHGRVSDTTDMDPGINTAFVYAATNILSGPNLTACILKLDSTGNFLWVKDWKSSSLGITYFRGSGLGVDTNDNIYWSFMFHDTLDANPGVAVNNLIPVIVGGGDGGIIKLDDNGNYLSSESFDNSFVELVTSFTVTSGGACYFLIDRILDVPLFDADPGPGVANVSTGWAWIFIKLNNNLQLEWAKRIPYDGGSHYNGIRAKHDGGVFVFLSQNADLSLSNKHELDYTIGTDSVTKIGGCDMTIRSIDKNGGYLWGGIMGAAILFDHFTDCTIDKNDNFLAVGRSGGDTYDFEPLATNYNITSPSFGTNHIFKLRDCPRGSSEHFASCDSFTYNSQVFYSDTIVESTYLSSNGCDSIAKVYIDIGNYVQDTLVVDTCNTFYWAGTNYQTSGMHTINFASTGTCDSFVTLDLTIRQETSDSINLFICDSLSFNNKMYYSPGYDTAVFINSMGCDSIVHLLLTPTTVDTSLLKISPSTLEAQATNATFQWIYCGTMQPIIGANSRTFTAAQNGLYACLVTQNSCTRQSYCIALDAAPNSIADFNIIKRIYPNPSDGSYQLELDKVYTDVKLEVRTISGQLIWQKDYEQLKETTFNINKKATGVYMLYIKQGERTQVKKLLKW